MYLLLIKFFKFIIVLFNFNISPPASEPLTTAIKHTADVYECLGKMYEDQVSTKIFFISKK